MEASSLFRGAAVVFSFCGAVALVASMKKQGKRWYCTGSASLEKFDNSFLKWVSHLLRRGVPCLNRLSRILLESSLVRAKALEATWLLEEKGFRVSVQSITTLFIGTLILLGLLGGLCSQSVVGALAVVLCFIVVITAVVNAVRDKQKDLLRDEIPEVLRLMSMCFQAGLSLLQTFQQVSCESKGPLRQHFARVANRLETGGTTHEALGELRARAALPELSFVAVALDVQHQSGGSVSRLLDTARVTVESEQALRRSLRVQTAQAKLSARVVSVLPFVLIALFSLISEGFLAPFFESFLGIVLLSLALLMQAAGIVLVRRMLSVEVEL